MEIKKIERKNYNIHIIDSDRFKCSIIQVIFTKEFAKEDIVYNKLLKSNMVYSTKKYNTKAKMLKRFEELYDVDVSTGCSVIGNLQTMEFSIEFLNPKYVDENITEDVINLFYEFLFNPNVKNGEFNKDYYEIIKKEAINSYNNIGLNPDLYSSIEYTKLMYKGSVTENTVHPSPEEINSVTPKKLYDYYQKLFDGTFKIDIIIHAEDGEKLVPLIEKKFEKVKSNKNKLDIFVKYRKNNKIREKEDKMCFSQSKIYLGYRVNNYDDEVDYYTLRVLNIILGTMNNSLLFDTVREKNSLCYNISSYVSRFNTSLTIYSGINKDNKEKAEILIKECVSMLKSEALVQNMIDTARNNIETFFNGYYDDIVGQINNVYMDEFTTTLDIEAYRKKLLSVSAKDIAELSNRLYLSAVYFMKGELE